MIPPQSVNCTKNSAISLIGAGINHQVAPSLGADRETVVNHLEITGRRIFDREIELLNQCSYKQIQLGPSKTTMNVSAAGR